MFFQFYIFFFLHLIETILTSVAEKKMHIN